MDNDEATETKMLEKAGDTSPSAMGKDVAELNRRIDDMVAYQASRRPWYRDTGVLISAAAFLTSIVTSKLSADRNYQQDVNSRKELLHSIISEYSETEFKDMPIRYSLDQAKAAHNAGDKEFLLASSYIGWLNNIGFQQTATLTKEAYSEVLGLGSDASAIDLIDVSVMFSNNNQNSIAETLLKSAVERVQDSYEYVVALRSLGMTQFRLGKLKESQATMEKALAAFTVYTDEAKDKLYVGNTTIATYSNWINFTGTLDCPLSRHNLSREIGFLGTLPPEMIKFQQPGIDATAASISSCPASNG